VKLEILWIIRTLSDPDHDDDDDDDEEEVALGWSKG
jgi:hypothetical protein